MVRLAPKDIKSMEGALARSLPGPDELLSFRFGSNPFSFKTFHVLALAADKRRIHAGVEIVFLDANGRLLRIHSSHMKKGAHGFAEMAAAALFLVHLNFHFKAPVS
jgi:hypothetical protein